MYNLMMRRGMSWTRTSLFINVFFFYFQILCLIGVRIRAMVIIILFKVNFIITSFYMHLKCLEYLIAIHINVVFNNSVILRIRLMPHLLLLLFWIFNTYCFNYGPFSKFHFYLVDWLF